MKIALIADIHGNSIALNAVLADAAAHEPDHYLILGDIVDGHDPLAVLDMVTSLPNVRCIYGNTDRYVLTGIGPPDLSAESVKERPDRIPKFQQATASFAWTKGHLHAAGWYDYLYALALEERLTLPDERTLLAVHASPGLADGPGIAPFTADEQLAEILDGGNADIICVGHTHMPFARTLGQIAVINPGSVSNPIAPDLRACYAVLNATSDNLEIIQRRVAYDHEAVINAVRASEHPAADFIIDHQRGQKTVENLQQAVQARWHMITARKTGGMPDGA